MACPRVCYLFVFYHGYVCSCVSWPGQKGSVAIVCLFTQQEIPLPLHPLITPAAKTNTAPDTHRH